MKRTLKIKCTGDAVSAQVKILAEADGSDHRSGEAEESIHRLFDKIYNALLEIYYYDSIEVEVK